jgi:hypothetical protein
MPNGDRSAPFLEFTDGEWNGKRRVFREGIVVAAFIPEGSSAAAIESKVREIAESVPGATVDKMSIDGRWVSIRVPLQSGSVIDVATELSQREDVRFTQPDFLVVAAGPTEPSAAEIDLWWLDDIRAQDAWEIESGKPHVLVGIIDSGIALVESSAGVKVDHEDLNSARFSLGPDYTGSGEDAATFRPIDEHGHGTAVAGIIAARADNELGVKGVNWMSPVCVCRVLTIANSWSPGSLAGADTDLNLALRYLLQQLEVRNDVDRLVINVSAVIPFAEKDEDVPLTAECFRKLSAHGRVIVCASAGNRGSSVPQYPAAFAHVSRHPDSVLAVSAYRAGGTIRDDSNYGEHITVAAPGEKVWTTYPETETTISGSYLKYGPFDQTSAAAPIVTGVASLIWSKAPGLTSARVIECVKRSARPPTGEFSEKFGSGMLDAFGAVPDVQVETSGITFMGVPVGEEAVKTISLRVKSCVELHLETRVQVAPGSSADGQVYETVAVFTPSPPFDEYKDIELPVAFRATKPGIVVTGTVTVICREFGHPGNVDIDFTASTVKGDSLVALVVDSSGSMAQSSGAGSSTRMDILKDAGEVLIRDLPPGSAMDITSFSDDAAHQIGPMKIPEEPAAAAVVRDKLTKAIRSLHAGGLTSIGDGLESAQNQINAVSDLANDAIIVFTDGRETAEKYVRDVIPMIKSDVYAIGLGAPGAVSAETLAALSDPYALITGDLDDESRYKVSKYFVQILADIRSEDVVLDPTGRLRPGRTHRIPFAVTDSDYRVDVVLMWPRREIFTVKVVGPGGVEVRVVPEISDACCMYRLPLPQVGALGARAHAGVWHVALGAERKRFNAYAGSLGERAREQVRIHGELYNLMVTAQTGLNMRCSLTQFGFAPGSEIYLRAQITEHGQPVSTASVKAMVKEPDGAKQVLTLGRTRRDFYEGRFTADLEGLYEVHFRARGKTAGGHLFTREQVRTGFTTAPAV